MVRELGEFRKEITDIEQGRKQPGSAAVTLIKVAQRNPEILEIIAA